MKVNDQVRVLWIFDLLQTLFSHVPFDGAFYFAPQHIAIGIVVAGNGLTAFAARYHVARYNGTRPSPAGLFLGGPPCPRGGASDVWVTGSRNVYVFIASSAQNSASQGAGGN